MFPPVLHHDLVQAPGATPTRWAFVLHGIYGAGRNWNSVFRKVVEARPDWGFVPVDLRGHGQSPPLDPPHTLAACVADLDRLAAHLPVRPSVVIGHSFGGKVALLYGDDPAHHVDQVWVVDSTPSARPPGGSAWGMLEVLTGSPGPFPSREAAVEAVMARGYERPVARWMGTNLRPLDGGAFGWRLDATQMRELLEDFFRIDAWGALEHPHGPRIHVLRATRSTVLDPEAVERLELAALTTGRVELHDVEGGHWLNADNPQGLVELFTDAL